MTLIDSFGSDLISILIFSLTITIIALSWFSTNVREFPFSANLLIIERRSRRLYTTRNFNGNLRVQSQQIRTDASSTQGVLGTTSTSNFDENSSLIESQSSSSSRSNYELVNELVEQTLVDNIIEGSFYPNQNIEMLSQNGLHNTSNISSGTGQASSQMIRNTEIDQLETSQSQSSSIESDELINILIKFVNEKERRIKVRPSDTILLLKKTHFSNELSNNKIVRFIYQGQFLEDKQTFKSYNIKDQTTIHCNIISKPNVSNQDLSHQSTSTQQSEIVNNSTEETIDNTTQQSSTLTGTSNQNSDYGQNILFNIELNHFLLPMLAIVLGTCWYIRLNFKHLFSPLSSLFLIIFTFLYAIFLINNLQSPSNVPTNNITVRRRIMRLDEQSEQAPGQQTIN